jgi:pyruvate/2-oxoglutarate dehydrogenase complex dihydrolipoamide acyltransferase (E2) component
LTPIIPPGQTFIIGIGRSRDRLAIQAGGQIVTETFMTVTLSGDHRVLTGLGGAKLLAQFSHICENPILLLQQGAFNK